MLLGLSLCVLAIATLEVQSAAAPFITPCKLGDAACATASAQAALSSFVGGIPELGVHVLDPMALGTVSSNQAGLKLNFKDTTVTGLKGCTIENVNVHEEKKKLSVKVRCSVDLNGNYKLGGQLLILPVQGQGNYNIQIRDIVIKVSGELATVDRDGHQFWSIAKYKHTFQVKTIAQFYFQNLFNGNKALAETVINFANTNWREVMQEIAPPVVAAIVDNVVVGVNEFFAAVPKDQLVL